MAAADTAYREQTALDNAVPLDCLDGIAGTGRLEPAMRAQHRADKQPVKSNWQQKNLSENWHIEQIAGTSDTQYT